MRLRSQHQFLRTTEPKRSRPLVNEAARNEVATEENLVATELEQIKRTHVATSTRGRPETVNWAFLLRIPPRVFFRIRPNFF